MKRWAARLLAVVMLAGAPLSASAQQTGKSFRIGMLSPGAAGPSTASAGVAFRNGLRDLGYIDGENITFEVRRAGDFSRLRAMASELAQLPVDLIYTDVRTDREPGDADDPDSLGDTLRSDRVWSRREPCAPRRQRHGLDPVF